jgi:hypothetical protein
VKALAGKRSTFNAQRSTLNDARAQNLFGRWKLNVGRWAFLSAFLLPHSVFAQSPAPQPDPLMQLMLTQPPIEISTNIEVRAVFDPPVVSIGEKSIYRVTINTVSDSVRWPEDIYAPGELVVKQSSRGQFLQPAGATIKPVTTINHHVVANAAGEFTIPEFKVKVYGRNVSVPSARLIVSPNPIPNAPRAARLFLEIAQTNVFTGQPIKVSVILPAGVGNSIQALQQVQLNGDGILLDQTSIRQRVQQVEIGGRAGPAYIFESTITPLVAGGIDVKAQGFTAGNQFAGGVIISGTAVIAGGQPQFSLLDSDAVRLNVEPLPRSGALLGFSGAIGKFTLDPPQMGTNRLVVGEAAKLFVTFRTDGDIKRLLPPQPPAVTNWQIFPPLPEGAHILTATTAGISSAQTFVYTIIPLTNDIRSTPEIPFSYFDPEKKIYKDLTIPALPVNVIAGAATAAAQAIAQAAAAKTNQTRLTLSGLARSPGKSASSLIPLQQRHVFWLAQLVPLLSFAGLWFWDRRRRFYEANPDVLIRKRALWALRQERTSLDKAAAARESKEFCARALSALRIASAPHFPATPRALVGGDVLKLLGESDRDSRQGDAVRKLFSQMDASQFGANTKPTDDLLALKSDLDQVLDGLEARLK